MTNSWSHLLLSISLFLPWFTLSHHSQWVQCPTPTYNQDSYSLVPSEPTLGGAINIIFSDAPISCQPIWQPNLGYFLYQLVPGKIMWGHQSHGNESLVEDREVETPVKSRLLMTSPNSQLCSYHHCLFFFLRYPSHLQGCIPSQYTKRESLTNCNDVEIQNARVSAQDI